MPTLRPLDINLKLYACFAILTCLGTAGAFWILTQLPRLNLLSVAAGQNFNLTGARIGVCLYIVLMPLAAAGLARWLRAEVARPMREAVAAARRVAAGDLGTKVANGAHDGELLTSMQEMNDQLAGMIGKVRSAAAHIASGAGEIARANGGLPTRAVEQAASMKEAASAIEALSHAVSRNADHAHQAERLARAAGDAAMAGGAQLAGAVGAIASINACAHRIGSMIGTIDDIAFQTNILALGAAVEAARAGEPGRGVALLAAEVRDLAQRSAATATEIKLLIDAAVDKAGAGTILADQAGKSMRELAAGAKRATDIVAEIASASARQSSGIEQVNQAILAMDQRTRHNAALVEQSSTAAAAVRDEAGSLSRLLGGFTLEAGTGAAPLLHLAHSNPNKLIRPSPAGAERPKVAAVRAVSPTPSV